MVFPLVASATVHTSSIVSLFLPVIRYDDPAALYSTTVVALNRRRLYLGSGGRRCEDHAVHSGGFHWEMLGFVFYGCIFSIWKRFDAVNRFTYSKVMQSVYHRNRMLWNGFKHVDLEPQRNRFKMEIPM